MNYLEFLEAVTDESIKKKSAYVVGGEKWHIGRIDGGNQGAVDKYMGKDMELVPKAQKPSEGPRYAIRISLKNEGRKVLQDLSDSVMITVDRNSSAKYGCEKKHGFANSWDCESHIQGKLCNVGDNFLEAVALLNLSNLRDKLTEMGVALDAAQPFADGYNSQDGWLRIENIDSV